MPLTEREYLTFTVFSWGYILGLAGAFVVGYFVSVILLKTLTRTVATVLVCLMLIALAVVVLRGDFVFWIRLGADLLGAFALAVFANLFTLLKKSRQRKAG